MKLTATTSRTDQTRCIRALIAWSDGDKYALDVVLHEVMGDPTGVPGILFALFDFTSSLGDQVAPDFTDQLRAQLLHAEEG